MDYAFLTNEDGLQQATCLTATDVTSGMCSSAVASRKGLGDYAVSELTRFVLECGRGGGELRPGALQSDQEPAVRQLLRHVAANLGMAVKHSPVYHSQSQGAVER